MISTLQGAWWLTLLGTEPSRKRLAPVMPLLPTTIEVGAALLGHVEDRVGRIALARVGLRRDAGGPRLLGRLAQRGVDVLARVDHPLQVAGDLLGLLAQAPGRHRLVGADDVQARSQQARERDRLAHGLARGLRSVGPHDDRGEHGAAV